MKNFLEGVGFIATCFGYLGIGGAIENGSGMIASIVIVGVGIASLILSHKYAGADDE